MVDHQLHQVLLEDLVVDHLVVIRVVDQEVLEAMMRGQVVVGLEVIQGMEVVAGTGTLELLGLLDQVAVVTVAQVAEVVTSVVVAVSSFLVKAQVERKARLWLGRLMVEVHQDHRHLLHLAQYASFGPVQPGNSPQQTQEMPKCFTQNSNPTTRLIVKSQTSTPSGTQITTAHQKH